MPTQNFFPSPIHIHTLSSGLKKRLNQELLNDALTLKKIDKEGQIWCKKNYVGGYTSYSSMTDLHLRFAPFMELKRIIDKQLKIYVKDLEVDLLGKKVEMTTCWVNVMPKYSHHSLHLHPLAFISGTYYVEVPEGSGDIKFEDPRIAMFMGCPPRKTNAKKLNGYFHTFKPKAGQLLLWESWLRHEVTANKQAKPRVSVSFNYEWV